MFLSGLGIGTCTGMVYGFSKSFGYPVDAEMSAAACTAVYGVFLNCVAAEKPTKS